MTRCVARERLDLGVPHRVIEREAVDEEDGDALAVVDVGEVVVEMRSISSRSSIGRGTDANVSKMPKLRRSR